VSVISEVSPVAAPRNGTTKKAGPWRSPPGAGQARTLALEISYSLSRDTTNRAERFITADDVCRKPRHNFTQYRLTCYRGWRSQEGNKIRRRYAKESSSYFKEKTLNLLVMFLKLPS